MGVKRKDRERQQIYSVFWVMTIIGALVIANVLFTMVAKKHLWSGEDALNSKIASSIVNTNVPAKRGTIYDRNYNVIAQEVTAYTIVAYLDESLKTVDKQPDYVSDTTKTSKKIAKILKDTDAKTLKKILDTAIDNGRTQTELGTGTKRISKEMMTKIKKLKLPGIHFVEDINRTYPVSPFSSNLIGFASYDEDEQKIIGKMGLEETLNEDLSGKDGKITYQQTVGGNILPGTTQVHEQAINGKNVVLTIDANLQETVENVMSATYKDNDAKKAWCIVMEAETGNILSWASYPSFDQNEHKEIPSFIDNVSQMLMEPGSVMKPFTYATAVDTGVFPENTYYRAGQFNYTYNSSIGKVVRTNSPVEGYPTITDALGTDYGTLTFEDGLAHSSNVGICELLANYTNQSDFQDYLNKFGFFKETNIPFVYEEVGKANLESATDYLSTGFGQSSSITALQLIQAYSAIFNDGKMVLPHVVSSIENADTGEVEKEYGTTIVGEPISEETASKMKTMLKHVLDPGMSGERFSIDGVDMMAKTGTGEYYDEEIGMYSPSVFTSSIMAAAPYNDPEIIVYWGMLGTNYLNYSSSYFQQIMQAALIAQGISGGETASNSDESDAWTTYTMPTLINHTNNYVQNKLSSMTSTSIVIGDGGNVIQQYPDSGALVTTNDKIFVLTDGNTVMMPNMIGWTLKDVSVYCDMLQIPFNYSGSGMVTEQSVIEGEQIHSNTTLTFKFE